MPIVPTWRQIAVAAKQVGVSRRTLQNWIRAGYIRAYKIAGDQHVYVDLDEIKRHRLPRPRDEEPRPRSRDVPQDDADES